MNAMEVLYELEPQFDSAKSFYHKAKVLRNDKGSIFLMSYSTIVLELKDATITNDRKQHIHIFNWYSLTTSRHINEFLRQHGYRAMSKKEMEGGVIL